MGVYAQLVNNLVVNRGLELSNPFTRLGFRKVASALKDRAMHATLHTPDVKDAVAKAAFTRSSGYAGGSATEHMVRRGARRELQTGLRIKKVRGAEDLQRAKTAGAAGAAAVGAGALAHIYSRAKKPKESAALSHEGLELGALDIGAKLVGRVGGAIKSTYGATANRLRKAAPVAKAFFNRATSQGRAAFKTALNGGVNPDPISRVRNASLARKATQAATTASQKAAYATAQAAPKKAGLIRRTFKGLRNNASGLGAAAIGAGAVASMNEPHQQTNPIGDSTHVKPIRNTSGF